MSGSFHSPPEETLDSEELMDAATGEKDNTDKLALLMDSKLSLQENDDSITEAENGTITNQAVFLAG